MSARRRERVPIVRSIGAVPGRDVAVGGALRAAPSPADRFVALDRLRELLDRLEWAPLRLGGDQRGGPLSPRLPHALVLHLAYAGRLASAHDEALADVPIPVDVATLAGFVRSDEAGVGGALRALIQAGAVQAVGVARADALPAAVRLAPALLGPAPRCAALDWTRLALATAGAPSAWVAAHVLAERLMLDEWTPMPRSALEQVLGCGVSGVRSALDRLTAMDVVERREQRGGVSAYRFAASVCAAHATPFVPTPSVATASAATPSAATGAVTMPPAARQASAPEFAPPPVALRAATGVRLTVGGVELDVPAGLRVRIALGADGTPQITFAPTDTPPG